jgi:cardiolipin synthase
VARRALRQLPNVISSIRILLVVPIVLTIQHRLYVSTLWLFTAAGVSDAVDGFLAKHFGWQSELGGILDPLADKLMLATVFVMLALCGAVPKWLTAVVLARDGIIVLGAVSYRALVGPVVARPTIISKLNTLCQIVFIVVVIGTLQYHWPVPWSVALGALVFVTVAVSGIDYVWVYGRDAVVHSRARRVAV